MQVINIISKYHNLTMESDNLVTVMKFADVNEAEMAKSLLEAEGIICYLRNEFSASVLPLGGDIDVEVVVAQRDVESATKLLNAMFENQH